MPQDPLPGKLVTLPRDINRDRFRRDYSLRNPAADTGEGSDVWVIASAFADACAPLNQDAVTIANAVTRATATGSDLDAWAAREGTARLPPTGASGSVAITASAGGTFLQKNDECVYNGKRYHVTVGSLYPDQAQVPVIGTDVGPATNLAAGSIVTWSAPRPGCAPTAVVVLQADGTGLNGGRLIESDAELRARLDYIAANPPASGNDAHYQKIIAETPGISVQAPFTYPAILGPGTNAVCFTLRNNIAGGNRIPNATQIAAVLSAIQGQMPASDGIFMCTVVANPINVNLRATWAAGVPGWVDAQPWPAYGSPQTTAGASSTPTAILLDNVVTAPVAGQTFGVFDAAAGVFRRKKILSVTFFVGIWILEIDTTNSASDTSYAPFAGQVLCPWSDSLDSVVPSIVSYFDTLGPGEQLASFFDPGLRQRRSPPNPQYWPSSVTNRLVSNVFALPTIQDVVLVDPTVPYAAPIGTPGVSSYMNTLKCLAIFPQ
jgi:uncharacterized phage protein gp47/JayE